MSSDRRLDAILDRHRRRPQAVLQVLIDIQAAWNHIPAGADMAVAAALDLPLARVRGVIGFYSFLSAEPCGRYRLLFSDDITDRLAGSRELMRELGSRLWLEPDKVSEDGLVSFGTTSCIGLCDQGPALLVNGRAITRLDRQRVRTIAELIRAEASLADWPADFFRVDDNIQRRDLLLGEPPPTDETVETARALGAAAIVERLRRAGLRGRGGAGFPTASKWAACRAASGNRVVVCNADEGEPGAFKDRVLLTRHADLLIAGMCVCALAIGARQGFIYLRGEYRYLQMHLETVLARQRAAGQLGDGFDIALHLGAGAYICGEESALLESLEGKRGIPRSRPPFPVAHGYLGQPTVVDNVETLCAAAWITGHGEAAWRARGTQQSSGTKLLSIAGDCARPGVYEYPFGVTVRQVLADCGASDTLAVQVGGPSGTCIGADGFERRLGFEDLPTAGPFIVFDSRRDPFEIARAYTHFFAHESCGFCTPCRVGTAMLAAVMDKIAAGHGTRHEIDEIGRLDRALRQSAHCGLGRTACNPTLDVLERFRPAFERRLKSLDFEPAFDLDGALASARAMTGRDDAGAHLSEEGR